MTLQSLALVATVIGALADVLNLALVVYLLCSRRQEPGQRSADTPRL
jgi:hypothetical protein